MYYQVPAAMEKVDRLSMKCGNTITSHDALHAAILFPAAAKAFVAPSLVLLIILGATILSIPYGALVHQLATFIAGLEPHGVLIQS